MVPNGGATRSQNLGTSVSIGEDRWVEIDVLAVDEAQFIPDLLTFCVDAADMENKKIIVAGLDGDFREKPIR